MATKTVTVTSGTSLSGSMQVWDTSAAHPEGLVALIMPAAWTTAAITFQASADGTNFFNLFNTSGVEVTIAAPLASQFIPLDPADIISANYLKIRSGTSGAPVNQGADRIVTLVTRRL
jgi:hypothetical protein